MNNFPRPQFLLVQVYKLFDFNRLWDERFWMKIVFIFSIYQTSQSSNLFLTSDKKIRIRLKIILKKFEMKRFMYPKLLPKHSFFVRFCHLFIYKLTFFWLRIVDNKSEQFNRMHKCHNLYIFRFQLMLNSMKIFTINFLFLLQIICINTIIILNTFILIN